MRLNGQHISNTVVVKCAGKCDRDPQLALIGGAAGSEVQSGSSFRMRRIKDINIYIYRYPIGRNAECQVMNKLQVVSALYNSERNDDEEEAEVK